MACTATDVIVAQWYSAEGAARPDFCHAAAKAATLCQATSIAGDKVRQRRTTSAINLYCSTCEASTFIIMPFTFFRSSDAFCEDGGYFKPSPQLWDER